MKFKKELNVKLNEDDLTKFYIMQSKINPISDMIGVITKNFEKTFKFIKKKYDKSYTIIACELTKSFVVIKEDFIVKYVVLETLDDIKFNKFKFKKYI